MQIGNSTWSGFLSNHLSMLQRNSLKNLVRPMQKWENVISVGGVVQVSQGVRITDGEVSHYQLPWSVLSCLQAIEL